MSKVYEALRQKEQESSERNYGARAIKTVEGLESFPFDADTLADDRALYVVPTPAREHCEDSPQLPIDRPASTEETSLEEYPHVRLADRHDSRLVFAGDPHSLAAEQFRFLRRNLEQKLPSGGVVLVTSPAPKDGKTFTALNLSSCLADSGHSTLLIECDIRQPSMHKVIGQIEDGVGVEQALSGSAEPQETIRFFPDLSLHIANVATPPSDAARVISGAGTKKFIAWTRPRFRWVIIDSPPVLPAADVTQLLPLADAALLVVRAQRTPKELVGKASELLGTRLLGVVLNDATVGSTPYYRYLSEYKQKPTASDASVDEDR